MIEHQLARRTAGGIDQNVDRPKFADRSLMERVDGFLRANIERQCDGGDAKRHDCLRGFGQSCIVWRVDVLIRKGDGALALDERADSDIGAGLGEPQCGGAPHSRSAAGYPGGFAFEPLLLSSR